MLSVGFILIAWTLAGGFPNTCSSLSPATDPGGEQVAAMAQSKHRGGESRAPKAAQNTGRDPGWSYNFCKIKITVKKLPAVQPSKSNRVIVPASPLTTPTSPHEKLMLNSSQGFFYPFGALKLPKEVENGKGEEKEEPRYFNHIHQPAVSFGMIKRHHES